MFLWAFHHDVKSSKWPAAAKSRVCWYPSYCSRSGGSPPASPVRITVKKTSLPMGRCLMVMPVCRAFHAVINALKPLPCPPAVHSVHTVTRPDGLAGWVLAGGGGGGFAQSREGRGAGIREGFFLG